MKAVKLGYMNLFTNNVEAMREYYRNVMGLAEVEQSEDQTLYLSSSIDHHNIILTPSSARGIKSIGLQVVGSSSLLELAYSLIEDGVKAEYVRGAQPGISEQVNVIDPAGTHIELYKEMEMTGPGFRELGIVPNKLGHITLFAKDKEETVNFYTKYLGFHISDQMSERVTFMTCNQDHHVLNFKISDTTYLHHIAFELRDMIHMKDSHDLLSKHKIPIEWGPTRHTAGHNIASYHYDPDHNMIELFNDMDIYIPELGYFEPRPWHHDQPQKPKVWTEEDGLSAWETKFLMNLSKG